MAKGKYVKDKLDELITSLENDYSKWGDISDWVRKDTIRSLRLIKKKLKEKKE